MTKLIGLAHGYSLPSARYHGRSDEPHFEPDPEPEQAFQPTPEERRAADAWVSAGLKSALGSGESKLYTAKPTKTAPTAWNKQSFGDISRIPELRRERQDGRGVESG